MIAIASAITIIAVTIRSRGAVPITRRSRAPILRGNEGRSRAPSSGSDLPQALQNAAPGSLRCPQLGQNMRPRYRRTSLTAGIGGATAHSPAELDEGLVPEPRLINWWVIRAV